MKTITLTVDIDGNAVSREYAFEADATSDDWGDRVWSMLGTLEKSTKIKYEN